jgi:hypothetical protein
MKRVRGVYNGQAVVLKEAVDLAPDTEVEVLIPDARSQSFSDFLDELDKRPPLAPEDVLSEEEVVALVHEVRAEMRAERECGS